MHFYYILYVDTIFSYFCIVITFLGLLVTYRYKIPDMTEEYFHKTFLCILYFIFYFTEGSYDSVKKPLMIITFGEIR